MEKAIRMSAMARYRTTHAPRLGLIPVEIHPCARLCHLTLQRRDIAFLVSPMRWFGHMRARLFLAFPQIFTERGGEAVGIGSGHDLTIHTRALTRPHAFFIARRLFETRAAVAQW